MPLLPPDYPGFDNLKKRSDVLDNLTIYAQNVQLQDSLLKLSKMDEDERLAVVNKIIDDLTYHQILPIPLTVEWK